MEPECGGSCLPTRCHRGSGKGRWGGGTEVWPVPCGRREPGGGGDEGPGRPASEGGCDLREGEGWTLSVSGWLWCLLPSCQTPSREPKGRPEHMLGGRVPGPSHPPSSGAVRWATDRDHGAKTLTRRGPEPVTRHHPRQLACALLCSLERALSPNFLPLPPHPVYPSPAVWPRDHIRPAGLLPGHLAGPCSPSSVDAVGYVQHQAPSRVCGQPQPAGGPGPVCPSCCAQDHFLCRVHTLFCGPVSLPGVSAGLWPA